MIICTVTFGEIINFDKEEIKAKRQRHAYCDTGLVYRYCLIEHYKIGLESRV